MLLHTSHDNALKNNWKPGSGRFGSALFFVNGYDASDAYVMTAAESTLYAISDTNEDSLNIATRWELDYSDDLKDRLDNSADADDSWDAQRELLEVAVSQGFDGVEDTDEQGTVYILNGDIIISMLEKI